MHKILVISLHRLGDNLQVTPLLDILKKKTPDAQITVLTEKGFESVFGHNPNIDNLVLFHRDRYQPENFNSLESFRSNLDPVLAELSQTTFDLVINRQSSDMGAVIAGTFKARERRGYTAIDNGKFEVPDPWTRYLFASVARRKHNPFSLYDLNAFIAGGKPGEGKPWVYHDPASIEKYRAKYPVDSGELMIAMQPGGSTERRRWDPDRFGSLARILLTRYANAKIVFIGSPGEARLLHEIASMLPDFKERIVIDSQIPLHELGAFFMRCNLFIANDSGPQHYAALIDSCRILCLYFSGSFFTEAVPYGPGNAAIHADLECVPCKDPENCPRHLECKSLITPEAVAELAALQRGLISAIDPAKMVGVSAYLSGEKDSFHESGYFPLCKPVLTIDPLMRCLYSMTFRKFIDNEEPDISGEVGRIKRYYSDPELLINGPVNFDVTVLEQFAQKAEELQTLKNLFQEYFLQLREHFH